MSEKVDNIERGDERFIKTQRQRVCGGISYGGAVRGSEAHADKRARGHCHGGVVFGI
jgi:hypothetical protein